jgi:trk system potassium uptake protein TrkA
VHFMKIVIAGGGMLGIQIAHQLIDEKHDVVIIEKDAEAARVASNELDCMVINNDGSRPEVLREAGVAGAAWYLALTGSDEVNIVSCGLVALESPKIRTVARVENPFYSELSLVQRRAFGLDVLINPALAAADTVARIVEEGFAEDVVPLHDGRLQLRYLEASAIQGFVDRTLQEIRNAKPEHWMYRPEITASSQATGSMYWVLLTALTGCLGRSPASRRWRGACWSSAPPK